MATFLRRPLYTFTIASILLTGCDDSNNPPRVTSPPPDPGEPPIVAEIADCTTNGFVKQSDVNVSPGGIWAGVLFDCSSNSGKGVYAPIAEDGTFRIIDLDFQEEPDQLQGSLVVDGDTFQGQGKYFFGDGYECSACSSTSVYVQGFARARDWLEGTWTAASGGFGYFYFEYREDPYEFPIQAQELAGAWRVSSNSTAAVWILNDQGNINGADLNTDGCAYSGEIMPADSRYSLYQLELDVANCSATGEYSGFAWLADPADFVEPTNNRFIRASVDDGGQRALRLFLVRELGDE
jgi:hypothetical protein